MSVSEGGNQLEKLVFGEVLTSITTEAAQMFFSDDLPISLDEFTEKFKIKNAIDRRPRHSLRKNFNAYRLGRCGFRTRGIIRESSNKFE
jgi:hypothetical protein